MQQTSRRGTYWFLGVDRRTKKQVGSWAESRSVSSKVQIGAGCCIVEDERVVRVGNDCNEETGADGDLSFTVGVSPGFDTVGDRISTFTDENAVGEPDVQ